MISMSKSKKSYEERLADLEKKQDDLKEKKKKLLTKYKEDKRKKDTHNKILLGATVLSILGRPYADGDENRLRTFLENQERRGKFFSNAMNRNLSSSTPEVIPNQNVSEEDNNDDDFFN